MQAIHSDWAAGVRLPSSRQRPVLPDQAQTSPLLPQTVTAALVGLKQRTAVFSVQRRIQESSAEPLSAVLPGVALSAVTIALAGTWLQSQYGLHLQAWWPNSEGWMMAGGVLLAGVMASLLPAWRAYRMSLADGLAPR
jgi:hypothetical protein